jgi:tetratricopeptide (TPR) repeat protein
MVLAFTFTRNSRETADGRSASTVLPVASTTVTRVSPKYQEAVHDLLTKARSDDLAGRASLAEAEFQSIVKQGANNKFGWYDLGVVNQGLGDGKQAQADYARALVIDPKFELALYNAGLLRFAAHDTAGAISYLTRAVNVNPNDANAHWVLALALGRASESLINQVSKERRTALKLNPALIGGRVGPAGLAG